MDFELATVKELQDKCFELGVPAEEAEAIKSRSTLVTMVKTLMAKDAVIEEQAKAAPEGVKKVASIEEKSNPAEDREVNKHWLTKAELMKRHMFSQELVSILIPLEHGEKPGVTQWVWTKDGGKLSDEEWARLSLEDKMKTHQIVVSGAFESPQENGFKYFIPKGVYCRVPKQFAINIAKSQHQTMMAGHSVSIDRIDEKTGKSVSEML